MTDSKLLGRGGAAFPTGRKWDAVARSPVRPHYLVCNADESEPGTFKDRVLMESDPFARGRGDDHRRLRHRLRARLSSTCAASIRWPGERLARRDRRRRARRGFLGDDIMGRGLRFDIEMRRGAGAYICGEETALFNSIEGFRGEPRNKPPFPVEAGLFGKPTVVNNVETPGQRARTSCSRAARPSPAIGTEQSTGTKLFCVSGLRRAAGPVRGRRSASPCAS